MSTFLVLNFRSPDPPRLTAELPEVEEDTPCDSLDECYLTYSALPDLSDSLGTCSKADITSFEDLDICSALEVASESSIVKVIKLQLDSQVDPLFLGSQPLVVQKCVIAL